MPSSDHGDGVLRGAIRELIVKADALAEAAQQHWDTQPTEAAIAEYHRVSKQVLELLAVRHD